DERERLVADLGDKKLMLLRNHGTLSVGVNAADAFVGIFFLERACAQQVNALSVGRDGVLLAPDAAQEETRGQAKGLGMVAGLARLPASSCRTIRSPTRKSQSASCQAAAPISALRSPPRCMPAAIGWAWRKCSSSVLNTATKP